jgi:hypothetical protein
MVKFYDVGNPTVADSSAISIEIFKKWDMEGNEGS